MSGKELNKQSNYLQLLKNKSNKQDPKAQNNNNSGSGSNRNSDALNLFL